MRKHAAIGAVVIALLSAAAGSAGADSSQVVIGCSSLATGRLALSISKIHPRDCGNPGLGGTVAGIQDAKWRHWGRPRATGAGYLVDGLGYRYPARFTALALTRRDRIEFYARLHVVSTGERRGGAFRPGLNTTVPTTPTDLRAHVASLPKATATPCASRDLRIEYRTMIPAAGPTYYEFAFVNDGKRRCTLEGYPRVSLVLRSGRLDDVQNGRSGQPLKRVSIVRHRSTPFLLALANPTVVTHPCVSITHLRVIPPGETIDTQIALKAEVCGGGVGVSPVGYSQ